MTATAVAPTKCRIAAKTLKDATALAASALPKRSNIPILFNLLLTSTDGTDLDVTGMDLELAVKVTVPTGTLLGDAGAGFAVCINGTKFASFVASLPDHQPVEMEVGPAAMVVKCANSRGRFPVVDAEDYPPFPGTKGTHPLLTAMGQRVGKAFDAVLPFVAVSDKGRPALMGAYLSVKGPELVTMGADGFIVSVYRALDYGVPEGKRAEFKRNAEIIVGGRAAAKLAEAASAAGESRVALTLVGEAKNPSGLRLESEIGGSMVVSVYGRCLEGPFPAAGILTVLPKGDEAETMPVVNLSGPLLASSVRRVSLFGADTVYGTPISLTVHGAGYERQGVLTLSAAGAEEGEGVDTLDCTATTGYGDPLPEGDALSVRTGSRYIVDSVRAIKDITGSEEVYLGFRGPNKAFTLNDGTHDYKIAVAPLVPDKRDPPPPPPVKRDESVEDTGGEDFGPVEDLSEA